MSTGGYDEGYRLCPCFWGTSPSSLIIELERILNFRNKQILDAGCGEGKNAGYLAVNGATVDAFDVSPLAIENARQAWKDKVSINWRVADIRNEAILEQNYDVVIAYGLTHCLLNYHEIEAVVQKMQNSTRVGGYNIVCSFNNRFQELSAHPNFHPCLLSHSDYISMYEKWGLISATDTNLTETHPHNSIEHTHSMTRILAKRIT